MHPTAPQGPAPAAQPPNPAQTAGIVAGVCAVLLLVALVTKGWASGSEGDDTVNVGLLGFEGCSHGRCESIGWEIAERLDIPGDVKTFKTLGLITGFAAVGILGFCAAMCLMRQQYKIPVKPFQFGLAAASACLTWFAVRLAMSDKDINFGPSWGAFVGIGAIVAGGFVLQQMIKPLVGTAPPGQHVQPLPQAYAQQMPPQQMAPQPVMCPHGHGPAEFVAQYQRYFCRTCNQYI
jgi:hypothetical protein